MYQGSKAVLGKRCSLCLCNHLACTLQTECRPLTEARVFGVVFLVAQQPSRTNAAHSHSELQPRRNDCVYNEGLHVT